MLTTKITNIADAIRNKTNTTDKMTLEEMPSKIQNIITDPTLQDKSVEIIENGTTTITADEGYDGLNNVSVTTNIASSGNVPENASINITEWDDYGNPKKVVIKKSSGSIPDYCLKAENITFTSLWQRKIKEVVIEGTPTSLGHSCFENNDGLETITLPDSINSFGNNCFYRCSKMKLDKLPSSLTGYMNQTTIFYGCSSMTIKTIPDGVTYISGSGIFKNCSSITQISMRNVTGIGGSYDGGGDFSYTGLKAVWIGSKITSSSFSQYAFSGCGDLQKMFIDLPRATVEAYSGYSKKWGATNSTIICNDDEGFITKEEFDAIDWSTYTM